MPRLMDEIARKLPSPRLSMMLIVPSAFAEARSGIPSPSKSATASDCGARPML